MLHTDAFGYILVQNSIICHSEGRGVGQCGLEDAWASFGIFEKRGQWARYKMIVGRTVAFNRYLKTDALVKEVTKIIIIELSAKHGIAVVCESWDDVE